ncbi:MAG: sporulation protein YabP [Firmicutes bacterium]|nr:sporulation protein YabP [Bacillota bacterium]
MNQSNEQYLHRVVVTNREHAQVEGVMRVDSFDDREIILETELGMMAIRGEELHIKELSLDEGHLRIEGIVKSLDYLEDGIVIGGGKSRSKGLLNRLFG